MGCKITVTVGIRLPIISSSDAGTFLFLSQNKTFFKPFIENYDAVFLDDFLDLIPNLNTNFYGMIDQLAAYKSQVFFGTFWSTMSGYVNRMRGYYIGKNK